MQGRPPLFEEKHQLSVLMNAAEYRAMQELVESKRQEEPGYSLGDLMRRYVAQGLAEEMALPKSHRDPKQDRVRRLHAIARLARALALEEQAAAR